MTAPDGADRIDLVARRVDFLERLAEAPADKPALVEALDCSRSTVDRAIRRLTDAGLVERVDDGYAATLTGRLAAERYRRFLADERTILDARAALDPLPDDADLPSAVLSGATVDVAGDRPHRLFRGLAGPLGETDRYRAALPRLGDTRHLRLVGARAIDGALEADLVVSERLLDRLREEFPRLLADLVDAATVRVGDPPPYGVAVLGDADAGPLAVVLTYDEDGPAGIVRNGAPGAVQWARERYEGAAGDARRVDDVPAPPAGTPRLATDVPSDLGFVRVDADYFADRTPGAPATGWQTGFDLVDVHYGHAFERVDHGDERRPVADVLVDRLRAGDDHVLLGPPGSGKSTVCRTVASRWVEAGHGPVFYRQGPDAGRFDRIGPLLDALEAAEGHALVVVEDATAAGVAPRVRDLLRTVGDAAGVAVLLEAREHDWTEGGALAPRLRQLRRAGLSTYRLPALDEAECARAVAAFEAATGRTVPLSPADLFERVRSEAGAGECYLLARALTEVTDPVEDADALTGLEADVAAAYDELVGASPPALDAGLLVATLAAADLEVDAGLVHALAVADGEAGTGTDAPAPDDRGHRRVEAALDRLAGRLTFGREGDDERGRFRTVHPLWAVAFLEHAVERAERSTVAAFERAVSAVFALADDHGRRARIVDWLGGSTPGLDRLAGDPDAVVASVFALAVRHSSLAPLFGTPDRSGIALPAACSPATRLDCTAARARAWHGYGDFERVERAAERLRERADALDVDAATRARARARGRRWLGMVADDRDELDAAREQFETGLAALDDAAVDVPAEAARLSNALGWIEAQAGNYDAAREYLDDARERVPGGPSRARSETLYYLGDLAWRRGDLDAAGRWLSESLAVDRDLGAREDEAHTLNALGLVADDRGDHAAAADYLRRSLERKREVGDRPGEVATLANLGYSLLERGDVDAAEDCFERALDEARELGMDRPGASALGGLGRVAHERGDYASAADYYRRQRERHRELDNERGLAGVARSRGDLARDRDDPETAAERYREAFERYRGVDAPGKAAEVARRLVDLHTERDPDAAARWCERGLELVEGAGLERRREAFERRREDLVAGTDG